MIRLKKEIEAKLIERYKNKIAINLILEEFNIGATTLYRVLKRNNITANNRFLKFKQCPGCGKEFKSRLAKTMFCSRKCYLEHRPRQQNTGRTHFKKGHIPWNKGILWPSMSGEKHPNFKPKVKCTCATCGKEIYLHPYRLKNVIANYCSRSCSVANQKIPQNNTVPEQIMKNELIKIGFKEGVDFIHQFNIPKEDGKHFYRCDFAFPKEKVIVEVQGDYFHGNPMFTSFVYDEKGKLISEINPRQLKQVKNDPIKFNYLQNLGWFVFPVWEFDIRNINNHNLKLYIKIIKLQVIERRQKIICNKTN